MPSFFTVQGIHPADALGLFLFIVGLAIGLCAATTHGILLFLSYRKPHCADIFIRTHNIFTILTSTGIFLTAFGGLLFYRQESLSNIPLIHVLLVTLLVVHALFLHFWMSPRLLEREQDGHSDDLLPASWQGASLFGFLCSSIGWWGNIFLVVVYLLGGR